MMLRRLLLTLALLVVALPAQAANRFLTCAATCTITAADTTIWGTTSGGTGASVPGSGDAVILDASTCVGGVTCTATMGAAYNPTWQSITNGACTASTSGCIFDLNTSSITLTTGAGFAGSGTGTRTVSLGSGTLTISSSQGTFDVGTATNLTLNANTSTINFSSTTPTATRTFATGGKAFNVVTVPANTTGFVFNITGAGTVATLTITGAGNVILPNGVTLTVTTLNLTGGAATPIGFTSASTTVAATVAVTTANISYAAMKFITFTGAPTAANSFDLGGNSGITINGPSSGGGGRIIGG